MYLESFCSKGDDHRWNVRYPEFPEVNDAVIADMNQDGVEWREERFLNSYGVVDTPEQLIELFPFLKDSLRKFCISFVEIRREHQSSEGGWRYHKWGSYYGKQNPQQEYLYDDKHIERVYTFHIYELTDDMVDE
jgi:hypothetical protein